MLESQAVLETWQGTLNDTPHEGTDSAEGADCPDIPLNVAVSCPDASDWQFAVEQIKRQIYNNTSISIPSPIQAMCERRPATAFGSAVFPYLRHPFFHFNSMNIEDLFEYRRLRSENLFLRILHSDPYSPERTGLARLSKGIFMKSVYQQPACRTPNLFDFADPFKYSPTMDYHIEPLFDDINLFETNPFDLGSVSTRSSIATLPYTYTFGARFCDPTHRVNDVLVRGNLPLWCQKLVVSQIINRMPLRPGDTVTDILTFAPNIALTFQSMAQVSLEDVVPELTLTYERVALELSEPEMIVTDDAVDWSGQSWQDRKTEVLQRMLFCDIPEATAQLITLLASSWVTTASNALS